MSLTASSETDITWWRHGTHTRYIRETSTSGMSRLSGLRPPSISRIPKPCDTPFCSSLLPGLCLMQLGHGWGGGGVARFAEFQRTPSQTDRHVRYQPRLVADFVRSSRSGRHVVVRRRVNELGEKPGILSGTHLIDDPR